MKNRFLIVASILVVLFMSGCSTRLVDFTVISSKNHYLKFDLVQSKDVVGNSINILGIGTSIKDAMDDALEKAGPEYDILINGVVRYTNYFFVNGYKVTGTAVSSSKLKAMLGEEGFEKWCKENNIFNPAESLVMAE